MVSANSLLGLWVPNKKLLQSTMGPETISRAYRRMLMASATTVLPLWVLNKKLLQRLAGERGPEPDAIA